MLSGYSIVASLVSLSIVVSCVDGMLLSHVVEKIVAKFPILNAEYGNDESGQILHFKWETFSYSILVPVSTGRIYYIVVI